MDGRDYGDGEQLGACVNSSWDNRVEIKGERRGPRDPGKKDRQRGQATVGL